MKCKGCGVKISEYCLDCEEKMLSEALTKAAKERQKKGRKGIMVFEDDPMYEAILARRDLESSKL